MADNIRHLESGDDPDMHEENIYDVPRGGGAPSEDVTSEAESLCEEERVRKLFQACDADGDGYIDSQDLLAVCRELNLEDSLEELMRELGADETGRISYDEFLRRRLSLRAEIDALRRQQRKQDLGQRCHNTNISQRPPEPDYIPTSSDNSLGGASAGKHESWEFDSGARDLSPEPASLQKLVEAAGGSTVSSPSHLLDLANRGTERTRLVSEQSSDEKLPWSQVASRWLCCLEHSHHNHAPSSSSTRVHNRVQYQPTSSVRHECNQLHLAALASLKAEVSDLNNRLHAVSTDRDLMEKTLNKLQLEKLRVSRESEDRLEAQAQRYEERLTELHSVIAELSRKLERQRSHVIREDEEEEEELEENEDVSQDLNYHSDTEEFSRDMELNATTQAPETPERGTEEKQTPDATSNTSADIDNRAVEAGQSLADIVESTAHRRNTPPEPTIKDLLDEISVQKEETSRLQNESVRARSLLAAGRDERDKLRKKIQELQVSQQQLILQQQQQVSTVNSSTQDNTPNQSPRHVMTTSGSPLQTIKSQGSGPATRDEQPVLKMAERVKLRKMETGDRHITASDLTTMDAMVWSTPVAEQLVLLQGLQGESSVQELLCRYLSPAPLSCTESAAPPDESQSANSEERLLQQVAGLQQLLPLREFELEMERLRTRSEHLRAQSDVLTLALDEARANSERLTLLCGKYESNCIALSLALGYSDTALEAYDVLLALLESELASLVATCRAAGIPAASHCPAVTLAGDPDNPGLALARAGDLRQTAEGVATLLLAKLDRTFDNTNHDGSKHHPHDSRWQQGEETRLRGHISRLKGERSKVRATTQLGLESVHSDPPPPTRSRNPSSSSEARKLDLETAVLMQELMAMREDKAELRARCHALEREKASLELRLSGHEAQRQAQGAALSSLQQQLRDSESRLSGSFQGEEMDPQSRQLSDALCRELRLKERLQEMMVSLDTVSRSADIRQQQANEMLAEMKRANGSLAQMMDKCKKKYQGRLRKLEHQAVAASERHANQVRVLKQRLAQVESELSTSRPGGTAANETSL